VRKEQYVKPQQDQVARLVRKNGIIYKRSVLEMWYDKGWLELENSRFCADDRLRFGLKLALDYYILSKENLHSSYRLNDKVDRSFGCENNGVLDAKDRYEKAIRNVPAEFWAQVRTVCLEDEEPKAPEGLSERQKAYFYYLYRVDLCRGLDRVVAAYN
jgi:hypothetical protein